MKNYLYQIISGQNRGVDAFLIKLFLWPISLLYMLIVFLRRKLFTIGLLRSTQLPRPVISIGNITTGGSGKTPLVIFVARYLRSQNKKVVILTRGYMKDSSAPLSDEVEMLKSALPDVPILVGANRLQNARDFLKDNDTHVFILDDGFQHLQIVRDLDIVTIDSTNPWGYGYGLPRGLMREPRSSVKAAHLFVLTRVDQGKTKVPLIKFQLNKINKNAAITETVHKPLELWDLRTQKTYPLTHVAKENVCGLSSLGNPNAFEQTIKNLRCNLERNFSFLDHHLYNRQDLKAINQHCIDHKIKTILTTEKDAVKLKSLLDAFDSSVNILVLRIELSLIHGKEDFFARIHHSLSR